MPNPAQRFVSALERDLAGQADAEAAARMKDYLRNQFEFLGVRTPQRRQLLRSFLVDHPLPPLPVLRKVVRLLWEQDHRELQHNGMELLHLRGKELTLDDLPLLEHIITTKSWWDTVDFVAYRLVGGLLARHPDEEGIIARRFSDSGNLWLIRTSILFQLLRKGQTNLALLAEMIDAHRSHPDFFIRKAIGWALRDYAKTDPDWVKQFVSDSELSPLSQREALKNL